MKTIENFQAAISSFINSQLKNGEYAEARYSELTMQIVKNENEPYVEVVYKIGEKRLETRHTFCAKDCSASVFYSELPFAWQKEGKMVRGVLELATKLMNKAVAESEKIRKQFEADLED